MFGATLNWHCWVAGDVFSIQKYWRYAWFERGHLSNSFLLFIVKTGESQDLLKEIGQQGQHRTAEASPTHTEGEFSSLSLQPFSQTSSGCLP